MRGPSPLSPDVARNEVYLCIIQVEKAYEFCKQALA